MRPESMNAGHRVSWAALVALVLVPLLAVGALIGLASSSRASQNINAAIVNLDESVQLNGQTVPMGRQLAAAIMERDDNITWTLADAKNARTGLADGTYAVVVTIPKEFSAAATSYAEADAARKATIDVKVSKNSPVTDAAVAQEIAQLATVTLNQTLTSAYLENIYVGFNSVGEQFTTIVDAANQLHDGAAKLADGTGKTSDGATQLADGMGLLADNSGKLISGGDQLVAGGDKLASGGGQLATGAKQLSDGVGQLAAQLPQLVTGIDQLATGADQLLGGIPAYTAGTVQVVEGVGQLKGGLDQVIAGLDQPMDFSQLQQLADGAKQVSDGAAQLAPGAQQLADGAAGIQQGAGALATGLGTVDSMLKGFSSGAIPPPAQALAIPGQITASFQCPPGTPAEMCVALKAAFAAGATAGVTAGFRAGTGTASAMLNTPDPSTGSTLISGAKQLADGAGQLSQGAAQFAAGAAQLADGAAQLSAGVDQLATELPKQITEQMGQLKGGLQQISDGAGQLVTGAQPLVDNAQALADGSTQLLAGINQLNDQVGALPAGVNQLASGASQLSGGVGQYTAGVGTFVDGVATYADGVGQYADGVVSAADGAQKLSDGIVQLDDGAGQLADGLGKFADGLATGKDQVPSFSPAQRTNLADVVSSPVETPGGVSSSNGIGLAALLVVAGLWLAGLGAWVVARAVPSDVVSSSKNSLRLWLRTVGLPVLLVAGVGAVLGIMAAVATQLSLGRSAGLVGLLALVGVSFVLVNHALTAWLGNIGRAISVLLLVLTVAAGVTSAAPVWLTSVTSRSPATNALDLVRTWMASGDGLVGLAGGALLTGVIGLGLSYLAIASRRQLKAEQFRRRSQTA